ncbi:MAG: peptidoglycan D,D-transpeptidase FtsI family protein [Vampirovibrionia bacterium]
MDTKENLSGKKEKLNRFNIKYQRRMKILAVFLLIGLFVLAGRLFQLQILSANDLKTKAEEMRKLKKSSIHTYRGDVTDRNGIILASDVTLYNVYSHPTYYTDWVRENTDKLAEIISPYIDIPKEEVAEKLKLSEPFTINLAKKVSRRKILELKDKLAQTENENRIQIRGIDFEKICERRYPQKTLAAHILGYIHHEAGIVTGVQNTAIKLLSSIKEMPETDDKDPDKHKNEFTNLEITGQGKLIYDKNTNVEGVVKPPKGNTLTLTIDAKLQYLCETELQKMIVERQAERGLVIMMNPKNGEILAMAIYPSYDPNNFRDVKTDVLKNWAIFDLYPPGSTFKILTVASGLETGVINTSSLINDTGKMNVQGWTITNYDYYQKGAPGMINLDYLLQHSSNIASAKIALMMDPKEHRKLLNQLGIGEKTGIDLPGETKGYLLPVKDWSLSTRATIGFGYGIATTPIQVASAVAALANDGIWVTPHVIKYSKEEAETKIVRKRVLSSATAKTTTKLLKNSIANSNALAGKIPRYYVAGKTGTSRKLRTDNPSRGYSQDIYTSFIGYFPADDPELLIMVVVDAPKGGAAWGNTVAGPVFNSIAREAARYLHIKPDKPNEAIEEDTIIITDKDKLDEE